MSLEDMRGLTQGIIGSYEARAAGLATLNMQTRAQLQQDHQDHQALAHQMHADLAHMRSNMRQGETQRQAAYNDWMKNVAAAHQTMAKQQHAHLAQQRADLAQGEKERSARVQGWLGDTAAAHQALAQQQRSNLAQGEKARSARVQGWLGDTAAAHQALAQQQRASLAQGEKARSSRVQGWLGDTAAAHQALAQQQRASLAKGDAQRSGEAHAWLGKIATSRAAGHAEWLRMEATLQGRRTRSAAVESPAKAPPPRAEPLSEEDAVTRVQVGQVTPEFASLRSRTFEYLAGRPDGTRLIELEQVLGVSRIHMARVVRSLIDEGKAEKRGLLYFAI